MVNINKLKRKIVENGLSIPELSSKIGINRATFYRKINTNCGENFTIKEANLISKALNLTCDEINSIFFSHYIAQMRKEIGGEVNGDEKCNIDQLKALCYPVVEYLKEFDLYTEISITSDLIQLKSVDVGIPVVEPDK